MMTKQVGPCEECGGNPCQEGCHETAVAESTDFAADIPLQLAQDAHSGTSMDPEKRAEMERDGYARTLAADHAIILAMASGCEAQAEFTRYREGYRRRYLAYLSSRARCMSTMIAGPSKFPAARQQKRGAVADKRMREVIEFRTRALAAIHRTLRPQDGPIMGGDADAADRLRAKIAEAEKRQELMTVNNATIRKYAKKGADAQVAALRLLGWTEATARKLLEKDELGRIGFPDFELKNNGANIRRLKERLVAVEQAKARPSTETEGAAARLEECPAENRVRLWFPGKPAAEVRDRLKRAGFRWSPTIGAWQAYLNHHALAEGRSIAGVNEVMGE
ncbi:MAG: hypothetical protein V1755_14735 [Chloroflexota bacterium]